MMVPAHPKFPDFARIATWTRHYVGGDICRRATVPANADPRTYVLVRPLTPTGLQVIREGRLAGKYRDSSAHLNWWNSEAKGDYLMFAIWRDGGVPVWTFTFHPPGAPPPHVNIKKAWPLLGEGDYTYYDLAVLEDALRILGLLDFEAAVSTLVDQIEEYNSDWMTSNGLLDFEGLESATLVPFDLSAYALLGLKPWLQPHVEFKPWYKDMQESGG